MADLYLPVEDNRIDSRTMTVDFGLQDGSVRTYDESFDITVKVQKNVLTIQNSCTITIANMHPDDRAALLGGFNLWQGRKRIQPLIPVFVRIGRKSAKESPRQIFMGSVMSVTVSQPPELVVTLHCMTSQKDKTEEITGLMLNVNLQTYE